MARQSLAYSVGTLEVRVADLDARVNVLRCENEALRRLLRGLEQEQPPNAHRIVEDHLDELIAALIRLRTATLLDSPSEVAVSGRRR